MKWLILLTLILNVAHAKLPVIDIKGINGDYLDENGRAHAEKAFYALPNVEIRHQDIEIDFNKNDKSLIIRDPSTTVKLDFNFSFLNIFKAIGFENVNIKSNKKIFTVTSDILDLYIKPQKYHIEDILVETDVTNIPQSDDDDFDILDGLLLTGKIKANKMNFKDYDIIIFDDLRAENPEYIQQINELEAKVEKNKIPLVVRLISFSMDRGKFTGAAKLDSYINLWLRLNGSMEVNKDKTLLTIQISKVKLGIFSFKKVLLKQLSKLELNNVKIDGDKILISLKNDLLSQSKANIRD